jgi:hypothetical protein
VTPRPILVTGAHRSGTTWVGRMISTSATVAYISEPFNILNYDPGICAVRFEYWFTYVCEENEGKYLGDLRNTTQWRYNLTGALKSTRHPAQAIRMAGKCAQFAWYRLSQVRPLMKDPIALFAAEWLASRLKTENVVMIRHPAAFAGSIKDRNWRHPFSHFANQPLLIRRHLQPFENQISRFAKEDRDIIDQAALLWNLIHYMILKYKETHPDWIYVRHEDLSRNPVEGFRSMFTRLGLEFSRRTTEEIRKHSFAEAGCTARSTGELHNLKRDSIANIDTWKARLSRPEIDRLRYQVQEISRCFYSNEEW